MSELEEIGFQYTVIDELPDYWKMQIRGWGRKPRPRCPWDGGTLARSSETPDHVQCLKCGRKYG